MDECNLIQQTANPSSITEAANQGSGNEETADDNLTAATAAATPCPEIYEQTQNTGECPAGDQIFLILSYHLQARYTNEETLMICKFDKLQHSLHFSHIIHITYTLKNMVQMGGFFSHWYSPKKLKYGEPRLGESMLTQIILDIPNLA